ncbi:DUF2975 domain-containing protein [Enterococcus columbae]|uniref:DUF2975 domain-containing protein n=1 Tax=Enterococcus columbae DSM 7374 = ATCC 51263 TaxID=1121865 RepID=S1NIL3_9ENTE|nr:DUF2975 domain-containing protein [Enterococcus columbae]EOT41859.1 hypothetical protein OMW_01212 [Enterococcus columbae DSM 7374 = ATCC 51263]EOW80654.1 hypothetical protein I568_01832 [Enterococcus columbae DSM 7374 = ATCC 51263]
MKKYLLLLLTISISAFFWLISYLFAVQLFTSERSTFIWQNALTLACLTLASFIVSYLAFESVRIWRKCPLATFQNRVCRYFHRVTKGSVVIFVLSLGTLPMFYRWADLSDAPGVMLLGLGLCLLLMSVMFICLSFTKLYQQALQLQNELAMVI